MKKKKKQKKETEKWIFSEIGTTIQQTAQEGKEVNEKL